MNKRKLSALIASLSLVAVIGIGATLAYFTDNAAAENVVTMGHVDITLTEHEVEKDETTGEWVQTGEEDITDEGLVFTDVLPGQTVPKDPTITLVDDSVDAYVRISMEIKAADGSGITAGDLAVLESSLRSEILANPDWAYSDGYYYYNKALSGGETAVLFETVTIPGEEWGNNTAGQSFSIILKAEAIQEDYFEPVVTDGKITGWGDVTVEPAGN